jgi:ABC-2 type transport system ATP-binding protein
MSYAIETVALTRMFGDIRAVDDLNLVVDRGTFFGFLGPNGAGKSTTIKMLTGLAGISSGGARVLGRDIVSQSVEVKKRIGVVPEQLMLYERLTGREHLTFVGRMYGLPRDVVASRAAELLELMSLHEASERLIQEYSHGMKKKLALAAALIHDPQLLFLDEPFEGIDTVASRSIRNLLVGLTARGVTVFLTSHILEIVEKLCARLAVIHKGRLVAEGSLADLQAGIELPDGMQDAHGTTLEEVFLDLVGAGQAPTTNLSWMES